MEATIKEISAILRSTEPMAAQFVQRIQGRVKQPVSPAQVLAAMQKISAKTLTLDKVVAKVEELQTKEQRKAQRRRARQQRHSPTVQKIVQASTTTAAHASQPAPPTAPMPARATLTKVPKTILEKLQAVLQQNWDRAEAEGLSPSRMPAQAFINAVYGYTDRREASRRRILQAAKQLDQSDVLLTPALVADVVHELFQS